jgi:hypothetical protein
MKADYANAWLVFDHFTGESRGYGFVDFRSLEASKAFVDRFFPSFELDGRHVYLNYAWPQQDENSGSFDWECPQCRFHNFKRRDQCMKCGSQRPAGIYRFIIGLRWCHGSVFDIDRLEFAAVEVEWR